MTLLASHLPLLYCLLQYRTGGRSDEDSLRQLKPYPAITRSGTRLPQHGATHLRDQQSDNSRAWTFHHRSSSPTSDISDLCKDVVRSHNSKRPEAHPSCPLQRLGDVRRILPGLFLSENDMAHLVGPPSSELAGLQMAWTKRVVKQGTREFWRYTFGPKTHAALKTSGTSNDQYCGNCATELGYEVMTEITDIHGTQHTVVNFVDGYQFTAAGRCTSLGSPCGDVDTKGGRGQCSQIYRAHWTMVWSPEEGARLVPHEVPSHCTCVNIGEGRSDPETTTQNTSRSIVGPQRAIPVPITPG